MNNSKKFLISLLIILTLLSAFAIYQISYAISTPEMDATGISLVDKSIGDTVNYTLNDLYSRYDIFCCQHGTLAFIDGQEIINIGGETFDVTSSTDKGTILLNQTFYNNNTPSYFVDGETFETVSNPVYEITSTNIATPKEAYILAEMKENTLYNERLSTLYDYKTDSEGNKVEADVKEADFTKTFEAISEEGTILTIYSIEERDEDGKIISATFYVKEAEKFYEVELKNITATEEYGILSYVQSAWWTTEAGGYGVSVQNNELATEAEAFEDYVLNAAKASDTSELNYESTQYEFTDEEGNVHTGEVKAPKFEYSPYWNEDANKDGTINENDNAVVAWDADSQTYKVGPFSINYVKGEFQTGERPSTVFAAITEAKIITNIGELTRVSDETVDLEAGQYRFIYKEGSERTDDSDFPNPDEVFYLEIAYKEGLTQINNIDFNFKYMKAGGEYHHLEGRGISQTWTVIKDTTYYNTCSDEECEKYHWTWDGNNYHQNYFSKTNVKLKCTSSNSVELQMFAYGINGARWYEETSLNSNKEWEIEKQGTLRLRKQVIDEAGNLVPVSEDTDFEFDVNIETFNEDGTSNNSSRTVLVTVKKGQSSATKTVSVEKWKDGVTAPIYTVTEKNKDGYELVNIASENGTLIGVDTVTGNYLENDIVTVIAQNKQQSKSGSLLIEKIVIGDKIKDKTFYFNIYIDGKLHVEKASINASTDWKYVMPNYTWKGEAPKYEVIEVDENGQKITPQKDGYSNYPVWATGTLEDKIIKEAYEFNVEEVNSGKLIVSKKLVDSEGNEIKGVPFKFLVKVDGFKDNVIEVNSGETWTGTYSWFGNTAPNYSVTECDNEDYEFMSIEASNGVSTEKTVTGSLITDDVVKVIANNKEEKTEGKIKITKQLVDKDGNLLIADKDVTFEFDLEITQNGETTIEKVSVTVKQGQSTATSQEYTYNWNKNESAPTYKVTETKIDGEYTLLNIKNGTGSLKEDLTIEVEATNKKGGGSTGKSGQIRITKQMVDKDGNLLIADKDTTFEFDLEVTQNGKTTTEKVNVIVKQGQSTATSQELTYYWKEGEQAPAYKVTETKINGNYELLEMTNSEGILSENTVIEVIAKNKVQQLKGSIEIVKNVNNDELRDVEFTIKINKNGKEYKTVKVSANAPYMEEFTWNANEKAPVITIEEINLPENSKLVGYVNNGASLIDGEKIVITAINEIILQKGKIQINKELFDSQGNTINGIPFEFRLSVEGYEDKIITVASGETWRSDYYYWTKGDGLQYTVTELDNSEYEFEGIKSSNGTVNGKSVSGNLENDGIITVNAINKTKTENEGSIKVTKQLESEDKIDLDSVTDNFEFEIKIYYEDLDKYFEYNGQKYNSLTINKNISGKGTTEPIDIKWYENEAPKYYIQEVNLPNNWKLKEYSTLNSGNLVKDEEIEIICINNQIIDRKYYFTMEMGGKVWNDTNYENGKPADTMPDGKIGENEEGLSDIKVTVYKTIKTSSGNIVDKYIAGEITDASENILENAILYTDENGIWKINKISVPALTESDKAKGYTKDAGYVGAYDVEFTYDGQTYEPTTFLEYSNGDASKYLNATLAERDNYLLDSMAIDQDSERNEFNKKFETITGENPIDDNGETIGQAISSSIENLYYTSTDRQASTDSSSRKVSTLNLYDDKGQLYSIYEMNARTSTGGLVYPFDSKTVLKNTDTEIKFGVKTISYYYHAAYPYLNSINLGLVERKNSDIALEKDLEQAMVVVNGKALKYTYGEIANTQFDEYPDLLYKQIQVTDKNIEYKLGLYKSDYYYRASIYDGTEAGEALQSFYRSLGFTGKEEVELDIYLKYKITVTNESDSYDVEIKEISDYYDTDMELVSANVSKYIQTNNGKEVNSITTIAESSYKYNADGSKNNISWTNNGRITDLSSGKEYNRIITTGLTGDKLSSGESRSIYVTFKVNKAIDSTTGIDDSVKLGNKYNIAEIDSYSTYYEDGRIAGKIDEDSAPGNINIQNHNDSTWYEDDANTSPVLIIGLYDVIRQMNGLAWEDEETESIQYEQKVGNGEYDDGENLIPNMKTELYEKVTVDGIDYDFLWPTDDRTISGLNGYTIEELIGLDSTINTDSEGKYNFTGIVAGNYVVRFTYGDSNTINYNGQDYKSTSYQVGFDNDSNDDGLIDNIWHDLTNDELAEKRVSDVRDNEARRLEVIQKSQTLTYENTSVMAGEKPGLEDYYMTADTAKINMNIEKNTTGTESIGGITVNTQKGIIDTNIGAVGATNITYDINNIDFGLEERSKTNIVLDKQIEEIKLITSSGDIILDAVYDISYTGDLANVVLNSEKSIGTENLQALNNSLATGMQGFRYINIDENILQGATVEIRYRFTALNTSEVDRCAVKLKEITDFSVAIADAVAQNAKGIFGTYLGKVYYAGEGAMNASGECDDAIVETTVHKLVDYVDNDVVFSSTNNIVKDGSWTNTTSEQLKDMKLIDENIINAEEGKILDEESRAYESDNKNNLIVSVDNSDNTQEQLTNPGFVKALKPFNAFEGGASGDYASSIALTVSRYYSSEIDSETIDNLAEIIEIHNDVGRRDVDTVQGNANPAEGIFVTALKENDASATEVITLTPPTGLSSKVIFTIQILSVILSAIAILTVGIIAIKKKVLTK